MQAQSRKPDPFDIPNEFKRAKGNGQVHEDLAAMQAEIERLKAENDALRQSKAKPVTMKVSEKGALSIYGMGRFPMTAYASQWLKIIDMADQIKAFIEQNKSNMAWKE